MPAVSNIYKTRFDGSLRFEDDTGLIYLVLPFTDGDFSLEGLSQGEYEEMEFFDREELASVRRGKRAIPTGAFSCYVTELSDATNTLAMDMLRRTGAWAAAQSTLPAGANADIFTVKCTLTIEGTDLGDAADHTIVIDKMRLRGGFTEGDGNKLACTFKAYIFKATEATDLVMT